MNAAFQERSPDPFELEPQDFYEQCTDDKVEELVLAMHKHPKLINLFYSEALTVGVDAFHLRGEL